MRLGDLVRGWDGAGLWVKGNNHVKFVASVGKDEWKTRIRRVRVRVRGSQDEALAEPPLWEIRWPDGASGDRLDEDCRSAEGDLKCAVRGWTAGSVR
jgi:hypothetical protein